LFSNSFLRSIWSAEYEKFKDSTNARELFTRLQNWAERDAKKETTDEQAFIEEFFKKTWDHIASGQTVKGEGFTCWPQFEVKGAGQGGGSGSADLALGNFKDGNDPGLPQVLCEFKDVRSDLDKPQNRKGNNRSPVDQCIDYLRESRQGLMGPILPTWSLVSDMNEFRLYIWGSRDQYQRFVIRQPANCGVSLIDESEEAAYDRFLFWKIFHRDILLTKSGKSPLERLLIDQLVREKALEKDFYREYQAYREKVFTTLVTCNPSFKGREGKLVRLTQRFLDRCLFILFCEDMGALLSFPPHILRDLLVKHSLDEDYDPNDDVTWRRVKRLFEAMRDGTPFREQKINRFNGGLFAEEPELEALHIPTNLFCARGQGKPECILNCPDTLLKFSAKYNFGAEGVKDERVIGLYTLGRIFEQSITDLEVMEAHAEGRESLMELSKRKRDGVYYTPEWVTAYIVKETVGARLNEIKAGLGIVELGEINSEEIIEYRKWLINKRSKNKVAAKIKNYLLMLDDYARSLSRLTVVDPACGSGAFLIQAFKYLYDERRWVADEKIRINGQQELWDTHAVMRDVLSSNIYGVDINAESVEITRLALWLHTALPDRPLASLDENIRCGNSLISKDFYKFINKQEEFFPERERERVNTFDWYEAFPRVFPKDVKGNLLPRSGFDCVIGNPPYVKFTHFRRVQEDVSEYLLRARKADGTSVYSSTQTGSFDMSLPFIEKGIELLNSNGKMGFIAPNVWMVNEYGQGFRSKIQAIRSLDRWIDFKGYQVFEEAITYTALQFYSGSAERKHIKIIFAPNGGAGISGIQWDQVSDSISYLDLPQSGPWNLNPGDESRFLENIRKRSTLLGDIPGIIVGFRGIETGADQLFQFERIGSGRYLFAKGDNRLEEFELEDEIMKPLVSGPQAGRYTYPTTSTYVLFPFVIETNKPRLWTANEMSKQFPLAWKYLKSKERDLRNRENGYMDRDDGWWGYNRPMNLEKQGKPKLGIAQTVISMEVFYDNTGVVFFNNVRVGGIMVGDDESAWFLLGVLNSSVVDFVFKRIAKSKEGGYFEANKQFLMPLPIPDATSYQKKEVAKRAKELQRLNTDRRDRMLKIERRLASTQTEADEKDTSWLWAEVKSPAELKPEAPTDLSGRLRTAWAKEEQSRRLDARLAFLDGLLQTGATLSAAFQAGEISFLVNGIPVLSVFVDMTETDFIAAQWRHIARTTKVTAAFNGKRLIGLLLKLRRTTNEALRKQVAMLDREIDDFDIKIAREEREMNGLIYGLYQLTENEIKMVEKG
jgi:hypothetical protein